jgi:hypothetical protein
MTPPTLPPEIEAALTDHEAFVLELANDPQCTAENAKHGRPPLIATITSALAAAREAGRREVLERARTLSTGADISGKNAIEAALLAYRNAVSDWEHSDPISGEGKDAEARQCAAYLDVLAATDEAETAQLFTKHPSIFLSLLITLFSLISLITCPVIVSFLKSSYFELYFAPQFSQ